MRSYPFITETNAWIKKNRLPEDTKVFIILGGYNDLRKALIDRNWVQNPDPYSPCFHIKWTL